MLEFVEKIDQALRPVRVPVPIMAGIWKDKLPFLVDLKNQILKAVEMNHLPVSMENCIKHAPDQIGAFDNTDFSFLREYYLMNPDFTRGIVHDLLKKTLVKEKDPENLRTIYEFVIRAILQGSLEDPVDNYEI